MTGPKLPKVSIHIISFNQRQYIAEAIESALGQDYENLEVVVSDDGSTDGTAEIIASYQRRFPMRLVSLLSQVNVGVTRNANRGLRLCSGKYIAFQGGDDVLLPGKVSAQVQWMEQYENRVLCGHQVEVFYQNNSRPPRSYSRFLPEGRGPDAVIRKGVPYSATSIMVRADRIPAHGFDESLGTVSDHMMWIEVLVGGGAYGYVKGTYSRYRRHSTNVTNRHFENLGDVEKSYQLISQRYPQYAASCSYGLLRHVVYTGGVLLLKAGKKAEARARFLKVVAADPFYLKAWIRLAQTF
jgi:glycosyltransferase involved in cell wall biosynthesis